MKPLRLILFLPVFLSTFIIGNFILEVLFTIIQLIHEKTTWTTWLTYLIKSSILNIVALLLGIIVYPFESKIVPLTLFTLIEFAWLTFIFFFLGKVSDDSLGSEFQSGIFNQIAITIGLSWSLYYVWKEKAEWT